VPGGASKPRSLPLVCLGDRDCLAVRARRLSLPVSVFDYRAGGEIQYADGRLTVLHQPLATDCVAGRLK